MHSIMFELKKFYINSASASSGSKNDLTDTEESLIECQKFFKELENTAKQRMKSGAMF